MQTVFQNHLTKKQILSFNRDDTILVKTVFNLLKKANLIQNDEDRVNYFSIVEQYFEPNESFSFIDNLNSSISDKVFIKRKITKD